MRRRTLANFSNATRQSLIPFSTSSGGGGRGRGRGFGGPQFDFTAPGKPGPEVSESESVSVSKPDTSLPGHGHGRGRPLPSSPTLPGFNSFVSSIKPPSAAGRGRVTDSPPPPDSGPKQPIFFKRQDGVGHGNEQGHVSDTAESVHDRNVNFNLPQSIVSVLTGSGRGKPMKQPVPEEPPIVQENRHARAKPKSQPQAQSQPRLTREEAVQNAVKILSRRGAGGGEDDGEESSGGRGRGRGRGRGSGRGWARGRGGRGFDRRRDRDSEDGFGAGLYLGDNADGEKLAKRLGLETMNQLNEAFEEMSSRVLPSPLEDAILDGMDINYAVSSVPICCLLKVLVFAKLWLDCLFNLDYRLNVNLSI